MGGRGRGCAERERCWKMVVMGVRHGWFVCTIARTVIDEVCSLSFHLFISNEKIVVEENSIEVRLDANPLSNPE